MSVATPTIGVLFHAEVEPEALPDYARQAEAAGLDELWLWEDCFRGGGIAGVTVALTATDRIRVGAGVLPMPLRNVALTAMEAATLGRLFPGRFVLGVGHGVQDWMGQAGARVASPLTLMREYVPSLRALLAGDEVTTAGRYVNLDRVRLDWPPTPSTPVWAAGEGARTLTLTGEIAEGTVLTAGTSPVAVAAGVSLVQMGREVADRSGAHPVCVFVMTVFAEGRDAVADGRARLQRAWDDWGLTGETRSGVVGTPSEVARQLRAYVDAGATTVILQPMPEADRTAFLRAAGETGALLRA